MAAKVSSAVMGQRADADRRAHRVDRWQSQDVAWHDDPAAEAWATLLRALCRRHEVEQMRADADEAAWRFTAEDLVTATPALLQGIASALCDDLGAVARASRMWSASPRAKAVQVIS